MLLTPHVAVGAAIGHIIPDPYIAGAVSFGSHYLMDIIPHWQETLAPYNPTKWTWIRGAFEIILIVLFLVVLNNLDQLSPSILIAIITGLIPDLINFSIPFRKLLNNHFIRRYRSWHQGIQNETTHFYGVITQLFVIILGLMVVFYM